MSTRCQVRVEGGVNAPRDTVTLYHHSDGYPTYMLPLFVTARETMGNSWKAGRAGYAASALIHVDVDGYQPESGHELHGDIAWYYVVSVGPSDTFGLGANKAEWTVSVYVPTTGGTPEKPGRLVASHTVQEAANRAEEIEDAGYAPSAV